MNPDAPTRDGSHHPAMTRHNIHSARSTGSSTSASTTMPYSTSAVHPMSSSSSQGQYTMHGTSTNPISVLAGSSAYQDPPSSSSGMYSDIHSGSASAMGQISQAQSAVPDLVFELASKALKHVQNVQGNPGSAREKETKAADKMLEKRKRHFKIVRFMFQAAARLHMKSVPLATACMVYHKVFHYCSPDLYDPYLIATTSIYLAGKIEEDHLKLRDVINVCYSTLHPERPPLDIGRTYWSLRETVVQCELFIMRLLRFRVTFIHPHKYLLHYIKSVQDLLHPSIKAKVPIASTAWAILRDSYHGNLCLHHDPEQLAVSALYLALQIHGVEVPLNKQGEFKWWEAIVEDIKIEDIWKINRQMMDIYSLEITAMIT